MKKLLTILVLGLLWCNVGVAEILKYNCLIYSDKLENIADVTRTRFNGKVLKIEFDTESNKILNKSDNELNILLGFDNEVEMYAEQRKSYDGYPQKDKLFKYTSEYTANSFKSDVPEAVIYSYEGTLYTTGSPYGRYIKITIKDESKYETFYLSASCPDREFTEKEINISKSDISDKEQEERAKKYLEWRKCLEENKKRYSWQKPKKCGSPFVFSKDIKKPVIKRELKTGISKAKYSCVQKDIPSVGTAKWTLSINRFSYNSFFVEHSCCPERGKKFAIYDEDLKILKWFDLIDRDLYFDILELSENKVKHKNFSIELEASDYKRFNKLYNKAEIAKKDHDAELISTNTYVVEEEKFYYTSNVFFREGMKDTNNFLVLFDADCE